MMFKKRFLIKHFVKMGSSDEEAKQEVRRLIRERMINKIFDFYYYG